MAKAEESRGVKELVVCWGFKDISETGGVEDAVCLRRWSGAGGQLSSQQRRRWQDHSLRTQQKAKVKEVASMLGILITYKKTGQVSKYIERNGSQVFHYQNTECGETKLE